MFTKNWGNKGYIKTCKADGEYYILPVMHHLIVSRGISILTTKKDYNQQARDTFLYPRKNCWAKKLSTAQLFALTNTVKHDTFHSGSVDNKH